MNNPHAFPAMHIDLADNEHGMTLRDYFAAKAMQKQSWEFDRIEDKYPMLNDTARYCYSIADAMMKAREQE